ncbi:TerD family protein [Flammeovirga yaeyamensis]|uniref:TerD family protein n=1 Tax=Flammeovirga yaeyamensis TaxID=367791 RepID=A0AAX1N6Z2_9BACT|nr:TerD family protein [Flammeovirga yaeyamensis]MBB3697868.1 tellurium resistance protein TerD [Flammeovirga yaeyamensis]NMF35777.1 TerD family protein [Flammeovirga yaeyamensis]QWG03271.1 TerD family protein [Flammeovirga yaeyamensis]
MPTEIVKKGKGVKLQSSSNAKLSKVKVGLGWEVRKGGQLDLDASVFMLGEDGKLPSDEYFVFYNNLTSPDGMVKHKGDNRTGDGEGDDEEILINLSFISPVVRELRFVVSIYDAQARRHNFGHLEDAYIRMVNLENSQEILHYDLDAEFSDDTEVEFARLVREDDGWKFLPTEKGTKIGLQGYVDKFIPEL